MRNKSLKEINAVRIIGTLVGDPSSEMDAKIKYGIFFDTVDSRFELVKIYNAKLKKVWYYLNAGLNFHPNLRKWKQRFFKNPMAFRIRSWLISKRLEAEQDPYDLTLQVGVLFDTARYRSRKPNLIYTDYTASLSARKPDAGRSPFNAKQRSKWLILEKEAYQHAAHICTRSQNVKESIIQDYGISSQKISVIGGGVNFERLPELGTRKKTQRPTVLFIGVDWFRKGGDILLRAFERVSLKIPNSRLLMLTQGDIPADFSLHNVEIVRPSWDREKIIDLYRQANVFVLPSRLETWGDVLLEAMSFGLPCIGVYGEAMEEIIEDEHTGLLIAPEDPEALSVAMISLLSDPERCKAMGLNARKKIEGEFTWQVVVDHLSEIILQVSK